MNDKMDTFFRRKVDDLVEKVGVSRARLLLNCISVVFACIAVAVIWAEWVISGPVAAIMSATFGCPMGFAVAAFQERKSKSLAASGGKPFHDAGAVPFSAKFLICFFLPKKVREPLLGDLEEEYQEIHEQFGERPARLWFYKQVLTSLWPMLQSTGRTLVKWGLIGWLEEFIRRIAH